MTVLRPFLIVLVVSLAVGAGLLLAGKPWLSGYASRLASWRDQALHLPEGQPTADLFADAVEWGMIVWDPVLREIALRRDWGETRAPQTHSLLFKLGEAGEVIRNEIELSQRALRMVSIRARDPSCIPLCDRAPDWTLAAPGRPQASTADAQAAALAATAATLTNTAMPDPDPRTHYQLWRQAGPGYGPWTSWHSTGNLRIEAKDLRLYDQIDIVGTLDQVPLGWDAQPFCRDAGVLGPCDDQPLVRPDAVRLIRQSGSARDTLTLTLAPKPMLGDRLARGEYPLTERIILRCEARAEHNGRTICAPAWQPLTEPRRYARGPVERAINSDGDALEAPQAGRNAHAKRFLGPWVQEDAEGRLVGSALAQTTTATSLIGGAAPLPGSVIRAMENLPESGTARFTLSPDLQKIVAEIVLDAARGRDRSQIFGNVDFRFPGGDPLMSVALLDLRRDPGAILATVGVPEMQRGLSRWDILAAGFDPGAGLAPGAQAWTGRGSQHTPGSTWKVFSALSMIDAIADGPINAQTRQHLEEAINGVTADRANTVLGDKTLSGAWGLCLPSRPGSLAAGTDTEDGCPKEFVTKAIQDSGRPFGGYAGDVVRYGLRRALEKSSNIWFVSSYLRAEYGRTDGQPEPLMATTARRFGLLNRQALDGGRGLSITPRDAISIDALNDLEDRPPLARAAFGQQVQAGPLVLAQVAASVAMGQDVRPTLITPAPAPEPLFASPYANSLLDTVRAGMRDVVATGTGAGPFRARASALKGQAFGKTGTAQRGQGRDRISSFLGWVNDAQGAPAYAIGCSAVVLVQGDVVRPLCAHMSAEIFARLSAQGHLE